MAASVQIESLKDWHESLIDYIIGNPSATLRQKAVVFGVSMSWLSIVENSDSFKEQMKKRRDEHFSHISRSLVQKLEATADLAMEEINSRMEADSGRAIPLNSLREIGDMALKHLGFGRSFEAKQQAGTINNNTIIVQDKQALAEARAAMAAARNGQPLQSLIDMELEPNPPEETGNENEKPGPISDVE